MGIEGQLKSELVLVVEVEEGEELAGLLCFKMGSLLMNYFGKSLGYLFKASSVWSSIIESMGWQDRRICICLRMVS